MTAPTPAASTNPSPPPEATQPAPPAANNTPPPPAGPSPLDVGKRFVKQYYQALSSTPALISRFYQPNASVLSHGDGSEPTEPCDFESYGITNNDRWSAAERLMSIELEHGAIDAQPSVGGGILLVVTGHVAFYKQKQSKHDERKAFVHTFLLATAGPTSKRWYVHNDILRFLKADAIGVVETVAAPADKAAPVVAVEKSTSEVGVATEPEKEKEEETKVDVPVLVKEEAPEPAPVSTPKVVEEKLESPKVVKPVEKEEEEAPGGGVEESKEVEPDEDVAIVAPKVAEKPPKQTSPPAASKQTESKEAEPKDKSGGGKGKKQRNGRGRSPADKAANQQQQQQTQQKPVPKQAPGSWASLVASTPSTTASPAKPKPVAEKPKAPAVSDTSSVDNAKPSAPSSTQGSGSGGKETSSNSNNDSGKGKSSGNNNGSSKRDSDRRSERDRPRRDPNCTLVIKNIPEGTKEADVVVLFEPFAKLANAKIVGTTVANHRGIAFVDYDAVAPVMAAIEAHGKDPIQLNGQTLVVDQKTAEQRARRNMRGGFRSGSPSNSNGRFQGGGGGGGGGGGSRQYRRENRGRGDRNDRGDRSDKGDRSDRGGRGGGGRGPK